MLAAQGAPCCFLLPALQTRRLVKFPEAARQKCAAFQLMPPRHIIPREYTRQKLPELGLPAEVRPLGGLGISRHLCPPWPPG